MKVPHNPTIGHQQPHTSQHHAAIEMTRKDRPSQMAATKARWALSTAMGVSFPPRTFVSTPPAPRKLALTHLRRPIQPHALLLNNRRRPISKIQGRREQARQSTTQRRQVFSLRCPFRFSHCDAPYSRTGRPGSTRFAPTSRLLALYAVSHSNPREEKEATGILGNLHF